MRRIGTFLVCVGGLLLGGPVAAAGTQAVPLGERTDRLVARLTAAEPLSTAPERQTLNHPAVTIRNCAAYPYGKTQAPAAAARRLIDDLADGLGTGLRCMSGLSPMGRLHPYHEYQAHRLLSLLESARTKTFQCVSDTMFATAVATSPDGLSPDDPLYAQLRQVSHPTVILDTYRLGGLLSRRFDDETYRNFFHLADDQIYEHRYGQPLRAANLHRYQDRPALLFHEVVHWLGHEHSAIYPDLAHLYETCCFGGSDYIADDAANRGHQQTACGILKDDELWDHSHSPYRQMRVWRLKGYDGFKAQMRADYSP